MSTFNLAGPMETITYQLGVKSSDNGISSRFVLVCWSIMTLANYLTIEVPEFLLDFGLLSHPDGFMGDGGRKYGGRIAQWRAISNRLWNGV